MFSNIDLIRLANRKDTELCNIMNNNLSDKGNGHHNYTKLYEHLFGHYRFDKLKILEIGIGSVNPSIPSNMTGGELGKIYKPGASIRGWLEYFPNSEIYCCDIDKNILQFDNERVKSFYFDQTNEKVIHEALSSDLLKDIKFDLIIDDGLHVFAINCLVMKYLLPKVKAGGYYIIEDIVNYQFDHNKIDNDILNSKNYQYIRFPNPKNESDNNLFIVKI
jgi:Methyltransferase domain